MRLNLLLIIFIINSTSIVSQVNQDLEIDLKNPPGTIKLNDSINIDVAPVDNLMYFEFKKSLITFWSLEVHKELIKLNNFGLDLKTVEKQFNTKLNNSTNDEYIKLKSIINATNKNSIYNNHPKYSRYPVVNISKSDAELFCKWRTDMVMLNWAIKSKDKNERREYPNKIKYRLPKTSELKSAINLFGYSNVELKSDKDTPIKPFRLTYEEKYIKAIFLKNNISEFTLDGLPFGTNWKSSKEFTDINDYTGFRCVCEIYN